MLIIRTPFRLPLGGGGTDLPAYYKQFGGQLLTASINRYMFVMINEPVTSDKIKLYHHGKETVDISDIDKIEHGILRESLKLHKINRPVEIGSMADIEAGTGMGSSSVFAVGLLAGLNALERKFVSPVEIAEEACSVEIDILNKPIGKQDQYAAALGGINELIIDKTGKVTVNPFKLDKETIVELENRLLMFYTKTSRDANEILAEQSKKIEDDSMVDTTAFIMDRIKEIGINIKDALLMGDIDLFGLLLNKHWYLKKGISKKMSSMNIDWAYEKALQNGAIGGKLMGAGGGGFLLLCCKNGKRKELKEVMIRAGLKYMDFRFEFEGVKILANY
jgi:D-glycero-alpha-D-manno-heptose-7-phosphate kinase